MVCLGVVFGFSQTASGRIDLCPQITDSGNFLTGPSRVGKIEQTSLNPCLAKRADTTKTASDFAEWLSREPLGEGESLNLYAYCHGDPINKVDVLGMAEVAISKGDLTSAGTYLGAMAQNDVGGAQDFLFELQLAAELSGVDLNGTDAQIQAGVLGAVQQAMRDGSKEWDRLIPRAKLSLQTAPFQYSPRFNAEGVAGSIMQGLAPALAGRRAAIARDRAAEWQRGHQEYLDRQGWGAYWQRWKKMGGIVGESPGHIAAFAFSTVMATDATTGAVVTFNGYGEGFGLEEVTRGERAFAVAMSLPLFGVVDDVGRAGRRAFTSKSLVLGEGMGAVKDGVLRLQAKGVQAKWYQAWGKNFPKNRPMTPKELQAALTRNERWIRQKVKDGYQFYDLGFDATRSVRSPFYELERRVLKELGVKTIPLPR